MNYWYDFFRNAMANEDNIQADPVAVSATRRNLDTSTELTLESARECC
jgi:hypothetical protein